MPTKTDFREFARHDRYRAFEIMLWWEGACNATDLSALFNVRRENVTKDIQSYRAEHGEQVIYDSINKTYRPSPDSHLRILPAKSWNMSILRGAFIRRNLAVTSFQTGLTSAHVHSLSPTRTCSAPW